MNIELRNQIVKHIIFNLKEKNVSSKSILDEDFSLNKNLKFKINDIDIEYPIFGCQLDIDKKNLKILFTDLSDFNDDQNEYYSIIHFDNSPIYCLSLFFSKNNKSYNYISSKLFIKTEQNLMECTTYLQATLLAAMEQIKDYGAFPKKCETYEVEREALISMIEYDNS